MDAARKLGTTAVMAILAVAVAAVVGEWAARQRIFHVTRAAPSGLAERLEASPALLIEQTRRGRRYRAGADVRVHHHPLAEGEVRIAVGAHGFRHPPLDARAADERRVLVLGDSVTAADYLPRSEVYTARLEALLADARTGAGAVQVVNGGVGNIGTEEEIALLEDRGLALAPDLVLLAFYLNDAQGAWGGSPSQAPQGLARYSVLAQAVGQLRVLLRLRDNPLVAWRKKADSLDWRTRPADLRALANAAGADWGAAWRPDSWQRVMPGLSRLRDLARERGFRAAVLAFPVVYQVEAEYVESTPQEALARRAAHLGLPFLDLLPALRDAGPEVFLDQCHLDARGHAVVAEVLRDFVLRADLLAPPRGAPARAAPAAVSPPPPPSAPAAS